MVRLLLVALGLSLLACAPAPTAPTAVSESRVSTQTLAEAQADAQNFRAAFSDAGVVWVRDGQACVARAPSFRAVCPRLGRVSDVAWQGETAWALLPQQGLVVTLDLAPQSLLVGAGAALSAQAVYRRDGSSLSYSGAPGPRSAPLPLAALTGGDGQDYVLSGGQLRRVADGAVIERHAGPFLVATAQGVRSSLVPSVETPQGSYHWSGGFLQGALLGQVASRLPHGSARVGVVRGEILTLSLDGTLMRFTSDLRPLH